jgi:hypothetical protein
VKGKTKERQHVLWEDTFIAVTNEISKWLTEGRMRWVIFKAKTSPWETLNFRKKNHYLILTGRILVPESAQLQNATADLLAKD